MFDYIQGRMISKSPTHLVLESAGIGYFINIPLSTYDNIPNHGEVKIYTQLFIREDLITLFGFATTDERSIFKLLISVSGIGPKIALAILSGSPLNDFKETIVNEDVKALATMKGIGKKTAERIILELKDSIKGVALRPASKEVERKDKLTEDAIMALISLGFNRPIAEKAVNNALKSFKIEEGIEILIRNALKNT